MKNRDTAHLNILSAFHYLAGIYLLLAVFFISRYVFAGTIAFIESNGSASAAESFTSWRQIIQILVPVILMTVMGIFLILAGHHLRKHRARIFCLAVAAAECLWLPFGTVLGVFTLIKLNGTPVKELFTNQRSEDVRQPGDAQ